MRKYRAYLFILAGICFLVYLNSLNGAFVSDDLVEIPLNPKLARPLTYWANPVNLLNSFAYLISGYRPFTYHLINIVLHALNTILVFFFLRLFFGPGASFLAACLFAAHPVHAEAVSWISGRAYLILAFFILTVYLLYQRATSGGKKLSLRYYLLGLLVFSYYLLNNFAFFALLPFFIVLSDLTQGKARKNWKLWLPFFALVIVRLVFARFEIASRISYMVGISSAPALRANPLIDMGKSLAGHFWLLLWPKTLTLYHGPFELSPLLQLVAVIFSCALILSLPLLFKKEKRIFFAVAVFILFLAPTFIPVVITDLVHERYLYFPSIAICIAAAFLYERYLERPSRRKEMLALYAFGLIMTVYAARTVVRNKDWSSPEKFWLATVSASPDSPAAYHGLGMLYYRQGQLAKAKGYFEKAIAIRPSYADAYNSLGKVYKDEGDSEGAIALYKKAAEINPYDSDAYYNLGTTSAELARRDEAINYFNQAIRINPRDLPALSNLGVLYATMDRRGEAVDLLERALRIDPDYAAAHFNLAMIYFNEKKYDLSVRHCDKAIKLGLKVNEQFLKLLKPYRK